MMKNKFQVAICGTNEPIIGKMLSKGEGEGVTEKASVVTGMYVSVTRA